MAVQNSMWVLPRRFLLLFILSFFVIQAAVAVTVNSGSYRLVIDDETGRFSLYVDTGPGQYTGLFFSENPNTSSVALFFNDDLLGLNDDKTWTMEIQQYQDGIEIRYTASSIVFAQQLRFAQNRSGETVALVVDNNITNNMESEASIGLRSIFDTTLGESGQRHFIIPGMENDNHEFEFQPGENSRYIESPASVGSFILSFRKSGIGAADRIVGANWKRLNESPWDYEVNTARSFNLLPFSINDSAIALYWNPSAIPSGGQLRHRIILSFAPQAVQSSQWVDTLYAALERPNWVSSLSDDRESNLTQISDNSDVEEDVEDSQSEQQPQNNSEAFFDAVSLAQASSLIQDITTLEVMLDQINAMLESSARLEPAEVHTVRQIFDTFTSRLTE